TKKLLKDLKGYEIVGRHSAVKTCFWCCCSRCFNSYCCSSYWNCCSYYCASTGTPIPAVSANTFIHRNGL
ncbi:MAG TPA: hypothetical protein EYP82_06500, partial [Hydrogenothermaceae bacterium]|nr:hypothetical protein [Hydrogenothermaceae bacterium]